MHLATAPWNYIIDEKAAIYPKFKRPSAIDDKLTIKGKFVAHPEDRDRIDDTPRVFRGPIGSANTLLKNEERRDYLRDHYKVKAIEMEGSGVADGTWELGKDYLVVRGTVDYCNPDKNDVWHAYAALIAASYVKSIIQLLS
jgi:nucleoside phosphorylase